MARTIRITNDRAFCPYCNYFIGIVTNGHLDIERVRLSERAHSMSCKACGRNMVYRPREQKSKALATETKTEFSA